MQIVLVHGIRTSATMWRAQLEHLRERGVTARAIDLPGHGSRIGEPFVLAEAFATIDRAVQEAAGQGPVLLVGHSMGGLLGTAYLGGAAAGRGGADGAPGAGSAAGAGVAGYLAVSCTTIPRGAGLALYRGLAAAYDSLPDRGMRLTNWVHDRTLPAATRWDFGAGGYALDVQDATLASLGALDLRAALSRIRVPLWFVNGQFDQLRSHERLFLRLAPHAELTVVPRTSHLVPTMRPEVFNLILDLAVDRLEARARGLEPAAARDSAGDTPFPAR